MTTSSKSIFKRRSLLSKTNLTLARFDLGAVGEPLKIRSSPLFPRIDLMDCSPRTNRKASATFDLPEPFGPTIAEIGVLNSNKLFLANDLNPASSRLFNILFIYPNLSCEDHYAPRLARPPVWTDPYQQQFPHLLRKRQQ